MKANIQKDRATRAGTAVIISEGGGWQEQPALFSSLSILYGEHGWALPRNMTRINRRPRRFASRREFLENRARNPSRRSVLHGASRLVVFIREGDILPISPDPEADAPDPIDVMFDLIHWRSITNQRAALDSDEDLEESDGPALWIGGLISVLGVLGIFVAWLIMQQSANTTVV